MPESFSLFDKNFCHFFSSALEILKPLQINFLSVYRKTEEEQFYFTSEEEEKSFWIVTDIRDMFAQKQELPHAQPVLWHALPSKRPIENTGFADKEVLSIVIQGTAHQTIVSIGGFDQTDSIWTKLKEHDLNVIDLALWLDKTTNEETPCTNIENLSDLKKAG